MSNIEESRSNLMQNQYTKKKNKEQNNGPQQKDKLIKLKWLFKNELEDIKTMLQSLKKNKTHTSELEMFRNV